MELSQQVASLELCKKLKELNIKQESIFHWIRVPTTDENIEGYGLTYIINIFDHKFNFKEIYSAFTVSELSEILPSIIHGSSTSESDYSLHIYKPNEHWHISYTADYKIKLLSINKSLANCMAEMIILLIENGHIKND